MSKTFLPKAVTAALPALGTAAALSLFSTAAIAQSACGDSVTVEPGDTLSGISERCNVPLETIQAANPDVDPLALQVGQEISLVGGAAAEPVPGIEPMPGEEPVPEPAPIEPEPAPDAGMEPIPDAPMGEPPALEPEPAPQAEPAPMPAPEGEPEPLPSP